MRFRESLSGRPELDISVPRGEGWEPVGKIIWLVDAAPLLRLRSSNPFNRAVVLTTDEVRRALERMEQGP